MKKIIFYYTQSNGNTKRIAEMIAKETGAELAAIETVVPYTGSYDEIVTLGQEEVNSGYKPEIKQLAVDLAEYDEVIIGTPTWWYTMAPAMLTFLTENKLAGKEVALFQTHGGWPGHAMKDMKAVCDGASIISEKAIQFDSTGGDTLVTDEKEILEWIKTL